MKPHKPIQPTPNMKQLSPDEQKVLLMAQRHRAEYWRRLKRVKAVGKNTRNTILFAACAFGLAIGSASLRAAETPGVSVPALFNEGNADQRAGRIGSAILNYERAQWLAPRDQAIAQNLHAAREKAGVAAATVPAWQRPAHALSFDGLTVLASISLLLFSLLVFGTRLIPTTLRGLARGVSTTLGVTALLAASAVAARWPELDRAVVQGNHATAHIAPAASSGSAFELKSGELVTTRRAHGDFVLVRTLDQRSGWVARSAVERIIPPTAKPSPM
jgi:hypothetical protein